MCILIFVQHCFLQKYLYLTDSAFLFKKYQKVSTSFLKMNILPREMELSFLQLVLFSGNLWVFCFVLFSNP